MAGVDEIDILNGLQHEQTAAASIAYTMDGEGQQYSVVGMYTIAIPPSVSGVNVIFNGNYDPDGAKHTVRVKVTKLTDHTTSPPTKTENTQSMEWTVVDPDSATPGDRMKETGAIDVSDCISAILHIDVCVSEAEATTGLEVIVMVRSETALDEWTVLGGGRFVGPTGTPASTAFAATEAAGQTTLTVTNPTAAHFNHIGKFIFISHTTVANCEIAWLMACGADA